ncbi:MAG: hypothetical protein GOU97_03045 [Nanoarchaeota archaeon]|nr:hypothetical protein [Nanoarchaeota archaeon]
MAEIPSSVTTFKEAVRVVGVIVNDRSSKDRRVPEDLKMLANCLHHLGRISKNDPCWSRIYHNVSSRLNIGAFVDESLLQRMRLTPLLDFAPPDYNLTVFLKDLISDLSRVSVSVEKGRNKNLFNLRKDLIKKNFEKVKKACFKGGDLKSADFLKVYLTAVLLRTNVFDWKFVEKKF